MQHRESEHIAHNYTLLHYATVGGVNVLDITRTVSGAVLEVCV